MLLDIEKFKRGHLEKVLRELREEDFYFKEIEICGKKILFVSESKGETYIKRLKEKYKEFLITSLKEYELVYRKEFCGVHKIDFPYGTIGGDKFCVIAGPCAVESYSMAFKISEFLSNLGVTIFRGSLFKPRTSPHTFQGLKENGIEILKEIKNNFNLSIVVEPLSSENINMLMDVADFFQIGSRNMQNFSLLKEAGESGKPIILKRGMSATLKEFLLAAEHILYTGNEKVILCERGIRTFSDYSRNTLDLSVVPVLKRETYLPVIVDPSHGTGRRDIIEPMVLASIVAGADGVEVEVHPEPDRALSDGPQSLTLGDFKDLYEKIIKLNKFYRENLIQS